MNVETRRPTSAALSPATVCDVVLDAAITAEADTLWVEPHPGPEDRYDLTIERQGRVIATTVLDGAIGAGMVARLALLVEIDLLARRPLTGRCVVRGPKNGAEIVVTTRPGRSPRAEVFLRSLAPRQRATATTPAAPAKLGAGSAIGQYTIESQLGAGGMGQVFKAMHRALGRACALKVLNHDAGGSAESASRFLREARAAARIKHAHIVDVFDFGYVPDGRPYLVMELLDGESLSEFMSGKALEPRVAVKIARELASALIAAHSAGVIHADVSPSNVLIADDIAKLVDFGLAQTLDDPARLDGQTAEFVFGTPSYIAPEIIRGLNAEPASDQYALGCVLFEMLSGEPPYRAPTIRDLCIKHLTAPVPLVESPLGALPLELGGIIERCLTKKAKERYPSMIELHAALVEAEQSLQVGGWRRFLTP